MFLFGMDIRYSLFCNLGKSERVDNALGDFLWHYLWCRFQRQSAFDKDADEFNYVLCAEFNLGMFTALNPLVDTCYLSTF